METRQGTILAVGACYMDTILTVPYYPGEDEKLRATNLLQRRGGNCPNTLQVLRQLTELDPRDSVITMLSAILPSRSSTGTQEIESSLGPGISLRGCIYREEHQQPASSYILRSQASDTRTIVNYNALPEMTREEFISLVAGMREELTWCHFEGRIPPVTLECMRYLRRSLPAVRISVEVEKPAREGLHDLAAEADVVFYSKSWAQKEGFESPEACLRAQAALAPHASLLCCTWGHEGASALMLPSFTHQHSPAYVEAGRHVVDTIGAGDTFTAGMLYGLICHGDNWDLSKKLRFANELAGRKVVQEGLDGLGRLMMHRPY